MSPPLLLDRSGPQPVGVTLAPGRALAALAGGALTWPLLAAAAPRGPEVVAVTVVRGQATTVATGFGVGPGRVVTAAHVLAPGGRASVRAASGERRPGRVVRVDRRADLALLAVPGLRAARARVAAGAGPGDARLHVPGEARIVTVRRRILARVRAPGTPEVARPALELGARVRAGDSGAPVVTASGRVAGVVFARSRRRPGTAYATDARLVRALLARPAAR